MTKGAARPESQIDSWVKLMLSGGDIPLDSIPLAMFRELVEALGSIAKFTWVIVLQGNQGFAQILELPNVYINIKERRPRYYTSSDFSFLPKAHSIIEGTLNGKYSLRMFLVRALGPLRLIILFIISLALASVSYFALASDALLALNNAILIALSVFLPILALSTLSADPQKISSFIRSGRYFRFAQSDKYISTLGLFALANAIGGFVLSSIFKFDSASLPVCSVQRVSEVGTTILASLSTLLCFWLVIRYQFSRKQELDMLIMTQDFFSGIRQKYNSASESGPNESILEGGSDPD